MSDQIIVDRYARVLYAEAPKALHQDMELIRKTLEGSGELRRCLTSPVVPGTKKLAVLEAIFGGRVEVIVLRFIRLLAQRQREALLLPIAQAYRRIREEALGITPVHARTCYAPSVAGLRRIQAVLQKKIGTAIRLEITEDASLLGGMILRIGDTVYDGSVRHQLSQLRSRVQRQEV